MSVYPFLVCAGIPVGVVGCLFGLRRRPEIVMEPADAQMVVVAPGHFKTLPPCGNVHFGDNYPAEHSPTITQQPGSIQMNPEP